MPANQCTAVKLARLGVRVICQDRNHLYFLSSCESYYSFAHRSESGDSSVYASKGSILALKRWTVVIKCPKQGFQVTHKTTDILQNFN